MNIIEHDHRAVKRATRPSLNSKSFRYAGSVLAGIELMYIIRKAQFMIGGVDAFVRRTIFCVGRIGPSNMSGAVTVQRNTTV